MEASVAGAEGQQAEGQEQSQQAAPDFSPVLEHMEAQFGQLGQQITEAISGGQQQQQDEVEDESAYEDDGFPDLELGDDGEVDPEAAQKFLDDLVQKRASGIAEQTVQKALAPVLEQLTEQRIERDADALIQQYPQLRDQKVADAVLERATNVALQLGLSNDEAAKLVTSRAFIELNLKAGMAEQAAAGTPAGESSFALEGAGGQGPAEAEPDFARQVVEAGRPSGFWM